MSILIEVESKAESAKQDLVEINKSLADMVKNSANSNRSFRQFSPKQFQNVTKSVKENSKAFKELNKQGVNSMQQTEKAAGSLIGTLGKLKTAIFAVGAAWAAVKSTNIINDLRDDIVDLDNQLKLITNERPQLDKLRDSIFDLSQATTFSMRKSTDSFLSFYRAISMARNVDTSSIMDVVKTLNQTLVLSGETPAKMQEVLDQIMNAISQGGFTAIELRSMMRGSKYLSDAIMRDMNMNAGQLKEFTEQGKFTADVFIESMQRIADETQETWDSTNWTVRVASRRALMSIRYFFGEVFNMVGISPIIAQKLLDVSDFFGELTKKLTTEFVFFKQRVVNSFRDLIGEFSLLSGLNFEVSFKGLVEGLQILGSNILQKGLAGLRKTLEVISFFIEKIRTTLFGIRETFETNTFEEVAKLAGMGLLDVLKRATAALSSIAKEFFSNIWSLIGSGFTKFWDNQIKDPIKTWACNRIFSFISGFLSGAIENIKNSLTENIVSKVSNVRASLKTQFQKFLGGDTKYVSIFENLKVFAENTYNSVLNITREFASRFIDFFIWIYEKIIGNSPWPDLMTGILDYTKYYLKRTIEYIRGFAGQVLNFFKNINFNYVILGLAGLASAVSLYLSPKLFLTFTSLQALLLGVVGAFIYFKEGMKRTDLSFGELIAFQFERAIEGARSLLLMIRDSFSNLINNTDSWVGSLISTVGPFVRKVVDGIKNIFSRMWEWISSGFNSFTEVSTGLFEGLKSAFNTALENLGPFLAEWGQRIVRAVIGVFFFSFTSWRFKLVGISMILSVLQDVFNIKRYIAAVGDFWRDLTGGFNTKALTSVALDIANAFVGTFSGAVIKGILGVFLILRKGIFTGALGSLLFVDIFKDAFSGGSIVRGLRDSIENNLGFQLRAGRKEIETTMEDIQSDFDKIGSSRLSFFSRFLSDDTVQRKQREAIEEFKETYKISDEDFNYSKLLNSAEAFEKFSERTARNFIAARSGSVSSKFEKMSQDWIKELEKRESELLARRSDITSEQLLLENNKIFEAWKERFQIPESLEREATDFNEVVRRSAAGYTDNTALKDLKEGILEFFKGIGETLEEALFLFYEIFPQIVNSVWERINPIATIEKMIRGEDVIKLTGLSSISKLTNNLTGSLNAITFGMGKFILSATAIIGTLTLLSTKFRSLITWLVKSRLALGLFTKAGFSLGAMSFYNKGFAIGATFLAGLVASLDENIGMFRVLLTTLFTASLVTQIGRDMWAGLFVTSRQALIKGFTVLGDYLQMGYASLRRGMSTNIASIQAGAQIDNFQVDQRALLKQTREQFRLGNILGGNDAGLLTRGVEWNRIRNQFEEIPMTLGAVLKQGFQKFRRGFSPTLFLLESTQGKRDMMQSLIADLKLTFRKLNFIPINNGGTRTWGDFFSVIGDGIQGLKNSLRGLVRSFQTAFFNLIDMLRNTTTRFRKFVAITGIIAGAALLANQANASMANSMDEAEDSGNGLVKTLVKIAAAFTAIVASIKVFNAMKFGVDVSKGLIPFAQEDYLKGEMSRNLQSMPRLMRDYRRKVTTQMQKEDWFKKGNLSRRSPVFKDELQRRMQAQELLLRQQAKSRALMATEQERRFRENARFMNPLEASFAGLSRSISRKFGGINLAKSLGIDPASIRKLKANFNQFLSGIELFKAGDRLKGMSLAVSGAFSTMTASARVLGLSLKALTMDVYLLTTGKKALASATALSTVAMGVWKAGLLVVKGILKAVMFVIKALVRMFAPLLVLAGAGLLFGLFFGKGDTFKERLQWTWDKAKGLVGLSSGVADKIAASIALMDQLGQSFELSGRTYNFATEALMVDIDAVMNNDRMKKTLEESMRTWNETFDRAKMKEISGQVVSPSDLRELDNLDRAFRRLLLRLPQEDSIGQSVISYAQDLADLSTESIEEFNKQQLLPEWTTKIDSIRDLAGVSEQVAEEEKQRWRGMFIEGIYAIGDGAKWAYDNISKGTSELDSWFTHSLGNLFNPRYFMGPVGTYVDELTESFGGLLGISKKVPDSIIGMQEAAGNLLLQTRNALDFVPPDYSQPINNFRDELIELSIALGELGKAEVVKTPSQSLLRFTRARLELGNDVTDDEIRQNWRDYLNSLRINIEKDAEDILGRQTQDFNLLSGFFLDVKTIQDQTESLSGIVKKAFDEDLGKFSVKLIATEDEMRFIELLAIEASGLKNVFDSTASTFDQRNDALRGIFQNNYRFDKELERLTARQMEKTSREFNKQILGELISEAEAARFGDIINEEVDQLSRVLSDLDVNPTKEAVKEVIRLKQEIMEKISGDTFFDDFNKRLNKFNAPEINRFEFSFGTFGQSPEIQETIAKLQDASISLETMRKQGTLNPETERNYIRIMFDYERTLIDQNNAARLAAFERVREIGVQSYRDMYVVEGLLGKEISDNIKASNEMRQQYVALQEGLIRLISLRGIEDLDPDMVIFYTNAIKVFREEIEKLEESAERVTNSLQTLVSNIATAGLPFSEMSLFSLDETTRARLSEISERITQINEDFSDNNATSGFIETNVMSRLRERTRLLNEARQAIIRTLQGTGELIIQSVNRLGIDQVYNVMRQTNEEIEKIFGFDQRRELLKADINNFVYDGSNLDELKEKFKSLFELEFEAERLSRNLNRNLSTIVPAVNEVFKTSLEESDVLLFGMDFLRSLGEAADNIQLQIKRAIQEGSVEGINEGFKALRQAEIRGELIQFIKDLSDGMEDAITEGVLSGVKRVKEVLGFEINLREFVSVPDDIRDQFAERNEQIVKIANAMDLPNIDDIFLNDLLSALQGGTTDAIINAVHDLQNRVESGTLGTVEGLEEQLIGLDTALNLATVTNDGSFRRSLFYTANEANKLAVALRNIEFEDYDEKILFAIDNIQERAGIALADKIEGIQNAIKMAESVGDFNNANRLKLALTQYLDELQMFSDGILHQATAAKDAGEEFRSSIENTVDGAFRGLLTGEKDENQGYLETFIRRMLDGVTEQIVTTFVNGITDRLFGMHGIFGEAIAELGEQIWSIFGFDIAKTPEEEIRDMLRLYLPLLVSRDGSSISSDIISELLGGGGGEEEPLFKKFMPNIFKGEEEDEDGKGLFGDILDPLKENFGDLFGDIFDSLKGNIGQMVTSFISVLPFNKGGVVPGVGNTDTIPAMLTPGEFVVKKDQVKKFAPLLFAINKGSLTGYNDGGLVGPGPSLTKVDSTVSNNESKTQQVIHLNITGDISRQTRAEIYNMLPSIAQGVNIHNKEKGLM